MTGPIAKRQLWVFNALAGLAAAVSLLGSPGAAIADQMPGSEMRVANWYGGAYADAEGKFSHCAMSASYKSGILMIFSVSKNYSWRVGWTSETWRFTPGQKVPIAVYVDGSGPFNLEAVARTDKVATAELPSKASIFDLMRKGYNMQVYAEGRTYGFNLDGTYAALTEILACVDQRTGVASRSQPPAPAPAMIPRANPNSTSNVAAEDRLEATKVVANILAQGEMIGFRILSDKEVAETKSEYLQKSDVVWRAEGVFGTLRVIPKAEGATSDIAAAVLASDAKACKGQFASGTSKDDRASGVMRLFTGCKDDSGSFEFRYTVVPLDNGSHYLFAMASKSASSDQERKTTEVAKADIMLRQAVFEVLKK
jgi:hypothetical protein